MTIRLDRRWGAFLLLNLACLLGWGLLLAPPAWTQSRGPTPGLPNALDQRVEMIKELREMNALLREQNALLKSGKIHVLVTPTP